MSTPQPLVILGAGGFGREVIDVVMAANAYQGSSRFDLLGVLDDAPTQVNLERLHRRGVTYLGAVGEWLRDASPATYLVGVGAPGARARLDKAMTAAGHEAATVVHPAAGLGSDLRVAPGTVVCAGVQISTNVTLGRHVHLNPNATVGHDTELGDFVSINPGGIISGDCNIGGGTLVGAGAVVLQGLTIGAGVIIGASACVTRPVPPRTTVKGVPAR